MYGGCKDKQDPMRQRDLTEKRPRFIQMTSFYDFFETPRLEGRFLPSISAKRKCGTVVKDTAWGLNRSDVEIHRRHLVAVT